MSVPSKRKSSSRSKRGRSHEALKATPINICSTCKQPVQPHHACVNCGSYKGKVAVKVRLDKKERELAKKAKTKKAESKKTAKKEEKTDKK